MLSSTFEPGLKLSNRAGVKTALAENSQETGRLCPGFLLVNGDPIRQSVIWT